MTGTTDPTRPGLDDMRDEERDDVRDDEPSPAASPRDQRWWRRIDKGLLTVSLVIGVGLWLVVRGLSLGVTGDGTELLPELIQEVDPVPNAVQALNQTRVFADLEVGHTGVFVIDGVEIPTTDIQDFATQEGGRQVDLPPDTIFEGGNNTLTFVPNEDAPITEFVSGEHRVQVIYWEIGVGRQRARSFTWTFDVV